MTVINTVARSIKGVNGFYRQLLPSHSAPHVGWDIFLFAICLIGVFQLLDLNITELKSHMTCLSLVEILFVKKILYKI